MAIHITAEVDRIIAFLNALLELDREAVSKLFTVQVECNDALDSHPTVQTGPDLPGGPSTFGTLGLINGLCGTLEDPPFEGWGPIARVVDVSSGAIICFRRTEDVLAERKISPREPR